MNTQPNVFTPAALGPVTLRNRIIKAATFEASTPNALVSEDLITYHRLPAAGGVGMTTVAYLAVSPGGRTETQQIWMRPEAIPGLQKLTTAVHAEGAAISAQIGHAGPVRYARLGKAKALAPGRFFNPLVMSFTKAATRDDIDDIIAAHATAAKFAIESGFDAVEIHLGHGYFCSSFLSPLINRRTDEFGGSLENRAKVARGVVMAVREAVGDQIAVTAKLNMTDGIRAGIRVEEALTTAKWLEKDGGLDAIELTAGSSFVNPMYLFRGDVPIKEFANVFKPPIRWGVRVLGKKIFREYALSRRLSATRRETISRRIEDAADPARRHHQPRDDGPGDGRGFRLRRDGPGPAGRTGSDQPDSGRWGCAFGAIRLYALQ